MKHPRVRGLLALLLAALLLAGCSTGAPNDMEQGAPGGVAGEGVYEDGNAGQTAMPETSQKLIYTITIDAETDDLNKLLTDLEAQLAQLGGYVQSKNVRAGSQTSTHSTRYATMTLRLPAEHFRSFVGHVEGATNILSSSETAEDVTLQYVAVESRITALEIEEARLLELLTRAESLNDLLILESKLSDIRQELEEVKSQLKLYDNKITYSTVHLNITEVVEFTQVKEDPSVWERISTGFVSSLKGVWTILTELFIFLIVALPYLAIPGVIVILILIMGRKRRNARHKKPGTTPAPPQES